MLSDDHPLSRILNRRVGRRIGGRIERYSVLEAILVDMAESAMAGDRAAARDFIKFVREEIEAYAAEQAREAAAPGSVEVRWVSQQGPEEALRLLGICQPNGARPMLLNQWAVDAALARQPGLWERLGESEKRAVEEAVEGVEETWRED